MKTPTPIVTIKKDKFPVYFGMAALSDFEEKTGVALAEMDQYAKGMPLKHSLELAFVGLKHGARRLKQECKFENSYDVADYLDNDPELLAKVLNVFSEQYSPKNSPNTDDKKK